MSAIPAELLERPQWVVWQPVERGGKITKPPFMGTAPDTHASTTDPSTWCTYADAVAAVEAGAASGAGFVFTGDDDFVGIDFDKCRDPETGEVDQSVAELISVLDSYSEVSPSGTGVHVIARGCLPGPGRKRADIEIYDRGRYFTMTGIPLNGLPPGNIAKRQAAVEKIWNYLAPTVVAKAPSPPVAPVGIDDHDLLDRARRAKNGADIIRLYDRGDWQESHDSQSEADLSLCGLLAFWTGRDPVRIDQLFRACALMRTKWDRSAGQGETYGARTVRLAVEGATETYSPAVQPAAPHAPGVVAADEGGLRIVPVGEFASVDEPSGDPLLGENDNTLLSAGGFLVFYGKGGGGKTTLEIDLAMHLAAGVAWLGIDVPRRCRVLLIENEGPRGKFRRKMRAKLAAWRGPSVDGYLHVLEAPWARFTFADEDLRAQLTATIREHSIDIIAAGPVQRLGVTGGGTPEEVAAFVGLIEQVRADLDRPLAGVFVHHENKAGTVSGAWEGVPDTLAHVSAQGNGATRVEWEKVRWGSDLHGRIWKLLWRNGEGFELDETPEVTDEDIRAAVLAEVEINPGCSAKALDGAGKGSRIRVRAARDALLNEGELVNHGGGARVAPEAAG